MEIKPFRQKLVAASSLTIIVAILIFVGAFAFVYLRGQDRNWDLLNYHYYAGYSLLHGRHFYDLAAANLQSFFNPMVNVFAYLSLKHLQFPFSAWSFLLIQLLSMPAIAIIAREVGRGLGYAKTSLTEVLALLLCVIAPLWWSELGTTFFSSWTAPLVIWGFYLLLRNFSDFSPMKYGLFVAGLMLGFAAGLKLTNAPFAIAAYMSLLYLSYEQGWRVILKKSLIFTFAGIIGFSATAWWNWYLFDVWGSPIFPLYNKIFMSPYYDFVNWRDMRWHFSSLSEFIVFPVQAAFGSVKTSEVLFADARFLIIGMLAVGAILCKPANIFGRQAMAFMLFAISGVVLWSIAFAYQRYLIPIELLLGLVIWILVLRIVEQERARIIVLTCLLALSFFTIKVPDWGHAKAEPGSVNPFSIEIGQNLSATPARYIVVGVPISYVLPTFHPESLFYGVGFSRKVDELIINKLVEPSQLPLRIIARDHDAHTFYDRLSAVGFDPEYHLLDCNFFKTGVGRYIVCEVDFLKINGHQNNWYVKSDFSQQNYINTKGVLWEKGLSESEAWGRWSDGSIVELGFVDCPPTGSLKLSITGHAFGPNIGEQVRFWFGSEEKTAVFSESDSEVTLRFVNQDKCARKLLIYIPRPISPQELGMSSDGRKLGIGFTRLEFVKE